MKALYKVTWSWLTAPPDSLLWKEISRVGATLGLWGGVTKSSYKWSHSG